MWKVAEDLLGYWDHVKHKKDALPLCGRRPKRITILVLFWDKFWILVDIRILGQIEADRVEKKFCLFGLILLLVKVRYPLMETAQLLFLPQNKNLSELQPSYDSTDRIAKCSWRHPRKRINLYAAYFAPSWQPREEITLLFRNASIIHVSMNSRMNSALHFNFKTEVFTNYKKKPLNLNNFTFQRV